MKQIIALGGGCYWEDTEEPLLENYILKQTQKYHPKFCFVPTASGDSEEYTSQFYRFFKHLNCEPSHLSLFNPPTRDLEGFVLEKDIIFVGGGNTKNLLALWREWGLDRIMRKAWEQGTILSGLSAGSICWFEEGVTDSFGDQLEPLKALGFLSGSHCPHYDGGSNRRPAYQSLVTQKILKSGVAADDGVAIHFIDQQIHKIVSSRPNAKAYSVYPEKGTQEVALETDYLGEKD